MKLCEALQTPGFHTTVMTTFGVEFDAFESIALARFRSAGCRNVILVCDSGMLSLALAEAQRSPKLAGVEYLVAKARAAAVFHPKLVVQIGKDRGRLIVSSANATAPGLAGNLEIAAVVECGAGDSGERQLVIAGWRYALRFLDERQHAVNDKLRFAHQRSPWLERGRAANGAVNLADGSRAALLPSGEETGLARRFADLVGARRATDRLVVVSPYWDDDLAALGDLRGALKPRRTVLLVDTKRRLFPAPEAQGKSGLQVSEMYGFAKKHFPAGNTRFIHAKMIVVTAGGEDHVLIGSANCTFAALGDRWRPGSNEEVCLYRRLPADRIFQELGLASRLDERHKLDVQRIPKQVLPDKLPLDEAEDRDPGTFELAFERITWWPRTPSLAKVVTEGRGQLELLDRSQAPIAAKLHLVSGAGGEPVFRIERSDRRPAYARIRHEDGRRTGLAIVASVEDLRTNMRDRLSAKAERVILELEFDDDEGLWLLDAIHTLGVHVPDAPPEQLPRAVAKRDRKDALATSMKLDYETFMRGRHREFGKSEVERNSLVGSNVSYVRAALNRLLGLAATEAKKVDELEDDEPNVASALDTGDEVGNSQDALERGFEHRERSPPAAELARRRREQDAEAIVSAVDDLTAELGDVRRPLEPADMLRVRALLTIIAVAAKPPNPRLGARASQMQVLPCSEENNSDVWPRLIGRVLVTLFGGPKPAIKRLLFEKAHDRIPDDVLEAWACCIWFAQAALAAAKSDPGCERLVPFLDKLAGNVSAILSLSKDEAASPSFDGVLERPEQRFGPRLRVRVVKQFGVKQNPSAGLRIPEIG
jgi:hypothetical protein